MKFQGIYVSTLTPFTKDYKIDHKILQMQIEYIISEKVHGIVVSGVNGEFSSMSIAERKAVIKTSVETAKKRIPVIAGAYSCSINETIELVNYAQEVGANAAIITTPYFFRKPSDEGMFDYFDCILKESNNFPIFLCNVPIYTLIELKHSIIENLLAKYDNIIGIKDLSGDPESITAYAGVFENLSVLIGSDRLVFHGLNVQCDGVVSAIGCIFPKYILNIYSTYKSGNVDQAWIEQETLTGIRALLKRFPSRAAQKYIFSQIKGVFSYVRPPLRDLSEEDKQHLQIILEEHGLLQKK